MKQDKLAEKLREEEYKVAKIERKSLEFDLAHKKRVQSKELEILDFELDFLQTLKADYKSKSKLFMYLLGITFFLCLLFGVSIKKVEE